MKTKRKRRSNNKTIKHKKCVKFSIKNISEILKYYKKYGIVCIKNGLQPKTRQLIHNNTKSIVPTSDIRVESRLTKILSQNDPITKTLYADKKLQKLFYKLHNYKLKPSQLPVEYRLYPENSTGMRWHKDLKLTQPRQVEMVYTIHNNNKNTKLVWKVEKGKCISIKPKQGDLVLVLPNTAEHKVTSLLNGKGTRSILKFIAHPPNAKKLTTFYREIRESKA